MRSGLMTTGEGVACWGPMWKLRLTQPGWSGSEPQGIISSIPSSSQAPSIRLLISSSLDVKSNFKVAVCSSLSAGIYAGPNAGFLPGNWDFGFI